MALSPAGLWTMRLSLSIFSIALERNPLGGRRICSAFEFNADIRA